MEKIETETINLIIEIIKQSGEKTSKYNFLKSNKDAWKIIDDSIQMLWNCLDSKNKLNPNSIRNVLKALKEHAGKGKEGKGKIIEMCISKLKERPCLTRYVSLLKNMLSDLESKGLGLVVINMTSEYDKVVDKLYASNQNLATLALEEYIEMSQAKAKVEESDFTEDKKHTTRIHLILILIFKGKPKSDSIIVFKRFLRLLTSSPTFQKHLDEKFVKTLMEKDYIGSDNSDIFFSVMNDREFLSDSALSQNIFKLYETLFHRVNLKNGALQLSQTRKNFLAINKQEKFLHLKHLWFLCLTRKLKDPLREHFIVLLSECYFKGARKYEALEAMKAWAFFNEESQNEMNSIRNSPSAEARGTLLGNMASIWLKVIEISAGTMFVNSTIASKETCVVLVVSLVERRTGKTSTRCL